MKLLYFGNERLDAQNLATAVRAIARNGTVSWTTSADRAAAWIAENKDVAALVVEGQADGESWRSLLKCVRSLVPRPAVIVVTPEGVGEGSPAPAPDADHYVERNSPEFRDLPMVVIRAVARARGSKDPSHPSPAAATADPVHPRLIELERKLAEGTAALQEAERRHTAVTAQLAERQLQFELATAGAATRWEVVDEQLRAATIEAESARQKYELAASRAERLAKREAELSSQLAAAVSQTQGVERRLADADAAVEAANARAAQERRDAAEELAERQRDLQALIDAELTKRAAAESALAEASRARAEAETRHSSAMIDVAAQLRDLDSALRASRNDYESSAADVLRLAASEAELSAALADVRASHGNLERRLSATEAAFQDADARATRERMAATKKAATREAELEGQIRHEREARTDLERARDEAAAARNEAEQQLARRETELSTQLAAMVFRVADADAARRTIEGRLAETIEQAAGLDGQLRLERTAHADLERTFAEAEAAWGNAQQQYDGALGDAARQLADDQERFARELSATTSDRDHLAGQVGEINGVLAELRTEYGSATTEVARLSQRETDLAAQLAAVETTRQIVETQLAEERASRAAAERTFAEAQAAWNDARQQQDIALAAGADELAGERVRFARELAQTIADRDRLSEQLQGVEGALAASEGRLADTVSALDAANDRASRDRAEASDRTADLEARLGQEIEQRETVERVLADAHAAAAYAERAFKDKVDALGADARRQQERLEAQLVLQRIEQESQRIELQERSAAIARERDRLQQSLAVAENRLRQLDIELHDVRVNLDETRNAADAESRQLKTGLGESERLLAEVRTQHEAEIDQLFSDHTSVVSGHRSEIQQLEAQLAAAAGDLDGTKQRLNAAQIKADTLPRLQRDLEDNRAELGRLFQQSALAMFRCSRNGEVTQANRAAMTLVGRRSLDELRGAQFAAGVFEDPNGLSWLIERCLSSRTRESIETTWRRKDGGRLFVRLSAYACASDAVEVVAEDLTRVHVLQERLGQAHRMEAVGRVASEIAVTCGSLLTDVHQQMQELLLASAASRPQGEQLLADVTRAAGLIRQLHAYGDEQAQAPALADLSEVIHDLEPVLKRVAGGTVDVQLARTSSRLNVDVGSERIERLLVNLASYGRGRMPFGGQLKIELGTTVVDRRFAAKHPNVRLGPHALITVTKTKSTRGENAPPSGHHGSTPSSSDSPKPGMDFGTLQGLVVGCGGHLWMTLQPEGDMVAKIRLPLLAFHDETAPRTLAARSGRVLTRLFSH